MKYLNLTSGFQSVQHASWVGAGFYGKAV